jgi:hypothetical protein
MKDPLKIMKMFVIAFILYGVVNLLNTSSYKDVEIIYAGLPGNVIFSIYIFMLLYGIFGILCGIRMLKLENWARLTAVVFVLISVTLGLFITPVALKNISNFCAMQANGANLSYEAMANTSKFFSIIFTLFELAFVYLFTRPGVKEYFK